MRWFDSQFESSLSLDPSQIPKNKVQVRNFKSKTLKFFG